MVIAKPEWFKKKKGFFSFEMTWQGTVYLIATASLIFIGVMLPQNIIISITITGLFLFLFFDMQYASLLAMDERGKSHYSIAMRNTAWGVIITMIIVSIILSSFNEIENNWGALIMVTAFVGAIINFSTRYKLEKES
ncbi:hypothetical protein [Methanobacterium petrolearium]|uniref:hypothetical protein n=1 Tax=Methanobacterium petrolearium TaxID=710190 RepID=UPI001AEB5331|nr:hypothetical protein [Methanobacterium petrolearium]MBP1944764.1 hypothetical protein [Methanobacterium petrolearium]